MELGQMGLIQTFIPEDSVDGEEFSRPEWYFFGDLFQHAGRDCRCVSP